MHPLQRADTEARLIPRRHPDGSTTYYGALADTQRNKTVMICPHTARGHRSPIAAHRCATRMWRQSTTPQQQEDR